MHTNALTTLLRSPHPEKGFRELYRHWPRVRRTLLRMGSTREEAEDVFQEALVVLFRKVQNPAFVLEGKPEHYLTGCCKFIFLKSRRNEVSTTVADDLPIPASELSDQLEEESKLSKAVTALKLLGERCRELLLGFYVTRLSMADLAQQFGYASENSAKNQKYKCMETARELYRTQQVNH